MLKNSNLAIGKIRTSFGINGFVKILSFSGENSHFYKLKDVTFKKGSSSETKKIEKVLLHGSDLVIKFVDIDTPEQAKKYIDWEIWVPRNKAAALKEGEYYISDLYGCNLVYFEENKTVICGKIKSVLYESGATNFLEVEFTDGEKAGKVFLVPFIGRFIGKVDLKAGTVELLEKWIIP